MQVIEWDKTLVIDRDFEGIVSGMPAELYHKTPGRISQSQLSCLVYELDGHPSEYYARYINPVAGEFKMPANSEVGTLCHALLLEGREQFDKLLRICEADFSAYTSPKSTGIWKKFKAQAEKDGAIPLLPGEMTRYERMLYFIAQHKISLGKKIMTIPMLFSGGYPELSLFCRFPGWDIPFRARLDYTRTQDPVINVLDLKSTSKSSRAERFRYQLEDFGGHIQMYCYVMILDYFLGYRPPWHWVAINQKSPYIPRLAPASNDLWTLGETHTQQALDLLTHCKKTGDWFPPEPVKEIDTTPRANYQNMPAL
jgi:hypothetical protein